MVTKKSAVLMMSALLATGASWAQLPTELYPRQVMEGEAVQLVIELGDAPGGDSDLSPLEENFRVLGRSQQSSTIMQNGRLTRSHKLTLTLAPLRAGKLDIPPFELEGDLTQPQQLIVKAPSKADQRKLADQVSLQGELSAQRAYVQQPLIYTLRVELSEQLFDGAISAPEIVAGEALIEEAGEQKQYRSQRGNRLIQVVEQRYLITPQRSGTLQLSPARLTGRIPQGQARNTVFGQQYSRFRQVSLQTDAEQIEVLPVPASFKGQQWLPAQTLTLDDDWQLESLEVGQPIVRTLTLEVTGLGASQLPELKMKVPAGVRQYPEEPAVDHSYEDGQLVSTLRQQVTLIPTRPGALEFPSVEVHWWNLTTDQAAVARIEPTGLQIAGEPVSGTVATTPPVVAPDAESASASKKHQPQQAESPASSAESAGAEGSVVNLSPLQLAGAGMALVFAAMGGWLLGRRGRVATKPERASTDKVSSVLQPDTSALKLACKQHNAAAARAALQQWAVQKWQRHDGLNLLLQRSSEELAAELQVLNRSLYHQTPNDSWQGDALRQAFDRWQKTQVADKATPKRLAPLNPITR